MKIIIIITINLYNLIIYSYAIDKKPNILFILGDDIGFGNVAFSYDFIGIKDDDGKDNIKIVSNQDDEEDNEEDDMINDDGLIISRFERKKLNKARYLSQKFETFSKLSKFTTPTLSWLANKGRVMTRHYVHNTCSPSRAAFQSGRLPIHVQMTLEQPCSPNSGVPRNMTGIAEIMKKGGYKTYFVGKWDAGMMTPRQTPIGRGYDKSLNYFSHGNWMWSENLWYGSYVNQTRVPDCNIVDGCPKDLWDTDRPASRLVGTKYEEQLFADRIISILEETVDDTNPFFICYCPRIAHYPLEAPLLYQDELLEFAAEPHRRVYAAMMMFLDEKIREIVNVIIRTRRWGDTLIIFTSDNGGPVKNLGPCYDIPFRGLTCPNGEAGASNHPLRGGKYTNFEGGIRAPTFISGGYLPEDVRGVPFEHMFHIADWYATFAHIVEIDPTDKVAEIYNLPPIDSINMWDILIYNNEGDINKKPRLDYHISKWSGASKSLTRREIILYAKNVILVNDMKLLIGTQYGANWGGAQYPNFTSMMKKGDIYSSTIKCQPACLFNVTSDPAETNDISSSFPDIVSELKVLMDQHAKSIWERKPTLPDPACIKAARERYNGFLGPWKELPSLSSYFKKDTDTIFVDDNESSAYLIRQEE